MQAGERAHAASAGASEETDGGAREGARGKGAGS